MQQNTVHVPKVQLQGQEPAFPRGHSVVIRDLFDMLPYIIWVLISGCLASESVSLKESSMSRPDCNTSLDPKPMQSSTRHILSLRTCVCLHIRQK